jgi:thiol:disulfide interchange protein
MMAAPDAGWMPFVKIAFGFALLLVLAILAALIALGNVRAESSFGLNIILGGLLTLSGGFAGWAFRDEKKETSEETGEQAEAPHTNSK